MRRHRRWLYGFLWLVIAAFIILYIPAFQGAITGSPGETVAEVGGLPVTIGEFQRAYFQQRQLYERLYQGRMDAAALRRLGLEEQVLEALVRDRIVLLEARRLGIKVTDQEVARAVTESPQFQRDGKYVGGEEIRRWLELSGITVTDFEEEQRGVLLRAKLEALITDGVSVSPEEAEREFRRRTEQVKAEYVLVDAGRYRAETVVGDDEVHARFEAKREEYRVPEKRVLSYVLLDQAALRPRVSVTEGDLDLHYQDHREEYKQDEEVCAAHILVKVKSTAEAKEGREDTAGRKIAEGLLATAKGGADFAALAKKSSEDKGSAERGGDLGCFPRGRMVPEFENAAFALEPGQTSELVKSPFGYHIIRVASRREEQVPPLVQVKERIRAVVTEQKVQALATQKAEAISRGLARGRKLEEVARDEGLAVQKSGPVARGDAPDPLSPALVARAFELKAGEVAKDALAVPRGKAFVSVVEVQASRLPELKEAQEKIKADLVEERAREKAKRVAAEIRAQAAKATLEKAATTGGFVRKETPALVSRGQSLGDLGSGAAVDEVAFSIPEQTLSEPVRVESGYAVLRVLEKKAFDAAAFAAQRATVVDGLRREKRRELLEAYLREAGRRFTVVKRPEVFKRVTS